MDSKLNHAIMLRSKLRNKFLKSRSNKDREAYKKQRNLCVSLLRQNKKDYFETLDMKSVTDNKMFWKTVAPLFSNKSKASNKITLSENEKLIINDQKCAEVFNNYSNKIVKKLNIPIDQNLLNDASIKMILLQQLNTSIKDIQVSLKLGKGFRNKIFFFLSC